MTRVPEEGLGRVKNREGTRVLCFNPRLAGGVVTGLGRIERPCVNPAFEPITSVLEKRVVTGSIHRIEQPVITVRPRGGTLTHGDDGMACTRQGLDERLRYGVRIE